ncbi:hypothetical protein EG329_009727 [Mollisiaceae sp. DMI_Dod_QoI]|nr:hypothetical protein EG329_009727 [Helotiales sp. DMI_Dod_QoI]
MWRGKQPKGKDLFDLLYRKAVGLPKYIAKEIRDMVGDQRMPPWVDSRPRLFNIWISEERRAWANRNREEEMFIEIEIERLGELWEGCFLGEGDYRRALKKKEKGQPLTKRDKAVLQDSIQTSLAKRDIKLVEIFNQAYETISKDGVDPFNLDERAEASLLEEAQRGVFIATVGSSSSSNSKRKGVQPSLSKPEATGKALRSTKK